MAKKPSPQNPLILSHPAMLSLGLKKQPFTETILAVENVFSDAIFDQLIETLKHHLQFSDLLLIIEGDLGSGKTTLYRRLIQEETPNLYILPVQAEATDTLVQLQQKISIHLKDQGSANYIDDNLKHLQVFDQNPVIIIDDAHVLSDTTLQELLRYQKQLETEKEVHLKILLFANKGMAQTLEQISDLQHNQLYVQDMPALTTKQINAFISHKLRQAGFNNADFLSEEQLKQILTKSKGLPSDVMKQAVIEIEKWVKKQNRKGFEIKLSKPVAVTLLALVLIIGSAAIFFALQPMLEQQVEQISKPLTLPTQPLQQDQPDSTPVEPDIMATDGEPESISSEDKIVVAPVDTETAPEPEAVTPPASDTAVATQPLETSPVVILPEEPMQETVVEEPPAPIIPEPAPVAATPVPAPAPAAPAPPEKPKAVSPRPDPALQELKQLGIRDAVWLKTQNPNYWTLQVLGARDPHTLVNFIKQHQLNADDTAWYVTDLKGQPWYVLLHNFYADQAIARQSIKHLPAGLQQAKPWVKSINSVQTSIKP